MSSVRDHRQAAKELVRLPAPVRQAFEVVRAGLTESAYPEGLRETIPRGRGRARRLFMIWDTTYQQVTYRMAWEVRKAPPRSGLEDQVVVWKYGAHEGFYDKLWRRAES